MIPWKFYLARRHVTDCIQWALQRGITTQEQLLATFESIGTTLPTASEMVEFLPAPPVATAESLPMVDEIEPELEVTGKVPAKKPSKGRKK